VTCVVHFPAQWVDASKFEAALRASPGPHDAATFEVTLEFPTNCKVMVDAAIRLLSLANQLASTTRRVRLNFEEGETGTMGYLNRMGFFDHLEVEVEVFPARPAFSAAVIHRGGNQALVEIARISKDDRDEGLPTRLTNALMRPRNQRVQCLCRRRPVGQQPRAGRADRRPRPHRSRTGNPHLLPEHLFHEALHQQMYDFRHGHTLLREDCDRADAPKVRSLWNLPDGNHWDSHRTSAAFHVYVYLTLLGLVADQRHCELEKEFGPLRGITGRGKSMRRGVYLASQIKSTIWDEFGVAGKKYVEFFADIIYVVSNHPPPIGCRLHLLLDRYAREAKLLESLLRNGQRGPDLPQALEILADREICTVSAALELASPGFVETRLPVALQPIATGQRGLQFGSVRQVLLTNISTLLKDGYVLSCDNPLIILSTR
jgi:hypothetical protein